ncbi:hypothetical protein [Deinococcus aquiradiocola]|nr:hypothetical protein [Deinococcus aquiradiocola]
MHVATVGNDPAPVALGFLHARHGRGTETLLLLDPPRDDLVHARQQALQDWLLARGARVRTGTLADLQGISLADCTLNLTGGSKPSVAPLFARALQDGADVFTVDAHGSRLVVHDVTRDEPCRVQVHLTTRDYVELYLPAAVRRLKQVTLSARRMPESLARILQVPSQVPFVQVPALDARYQKGPLGAWLVTQNSHLYVVWDAPAMRLQGSRYERARLLARLTRDLGGQLATPVLYMPDFVPAQSGDGLLEYVQQELGASIVSDRGEWRPEPLRWPDASATAPSREDAAADASTRRVYVVLLGAQPMPGIIGIQAQEEVPDRVYLLGTAGVQRTAENVRAGLSAAPQLAGSEVRTVRIDENTPHLLAQALTRIADAHPDAHLTLNLTGGTKALALHALKWAANTRAVRPVRTEFTQQQRVGDGREPGWHLSLEQELQVRGVQIKSSLPVPAGVPSVLKAAEHLFVRMTDEHAAAFRRQVERHFPGQFTSATANEGLAAEYLSIRGLVDALPQGRVRHLRWATKLIFPSPHRPEGFEREVDGIAVLDDGRLLLMETKRDLLKGVQSEGETLQTSELAERLSGLHAHALIVGGYRATGDPPGHAWTEAVRRSGTLGAAFSVWSLSPKHPTPQPANVRRFPEDLPAFFSLDRGVS